MLQFRKMRLKVYQINLRVRSYMAGFIVSQSHYKLAIKGEIC